MLTFHMDKFGYQAHKQNSDIIKTYIWETTKILGKNMKNISD